MKKIFFLSLLSFSVTFAALAVTVSDNITLSLGSDSYTLETDSSFNTLTINSNNFVFLLDSNQGVKLRSSDRRNLANDQSVQVECTSSQSRLVYQAPAGGSSVTLTVTPSGTCSSGGEAALRVAGAPVVAAEEVVVEEAEEAAVAEVLLRQRRHRLLLQPLRLLQRLPPLPHLYLLHAIWPLVLLGMM